MLTRLKDYFWTKKTVKIIKKYGIPVEVDGKRGIAFFGEVFYGRVVGWFMPSDGSVYLKCVWAGKLVPVVDDDGQPFIKVYSTNEYDDDYEED